MIISKLLLSKEGFVLKKITGILLICSILLFAACSNEDKANSVGSSSSTESSSVAKEKEDSEEKKAEEAKKKDEEKKKQEEIAKKVVEADTAMKAAEAIPTDETIANAKRAIDAIPGGNSELSKRLETTMANLEIIKQQAPVPNSENDVNDNQQAEWEAELARRKEIVRQDEINRQAEIDRQVEENRAKYPPTIETDENGRQYIFENHDAYKDEPYYTEDWKNNPSPYQD